MIVVNNHAKPSRLGEEMDIWGLSELAKARIGRVITIPGAPAGLSLSVVAALAGGILLIAAMKKKRLL